MTLYSPHLGLKHLLLLNVRKAHCFLTPLQFFLTCTFSGFYETCLILQVMKVLYARYPFFYFVF